MNINFKYLLMPLIAFFITVFHPNIQSFTIVTNPIFNATISGSSPISLNIVEANRFIPLSNLTINHLGYYSSGSIPLTTFRNVGIWDVTTQVLIASAPILSTSLQVGNYRWVQIPTITLFQNQLYVIGSSELAGSFPNTAISFMNPNGVTFTGTGGSNRSTANLGSIPANSLIYPSNGQTGGGNPANAAAFITPEPETYLILGSFLLLGVGICAFSRKRKIIP